MDLSVALQVSSWDAPGLNQQGSQPRFPLGEGGGLRVVNPFALPLDPQLLSLLARRSTGQPCRKRPAMD